MRLSSIRIGAMACCIFGASIVLFAYTTASAQTSSLGKLCTQCACPDSGTNKPCKLNGGSDGEACGATETCAPCASSASQCAVSQ